MKNTNSISAIIVAALISFSTLCAQKTFTFTSAGATGSVGPTQTQVNNAYANTNLSLAVVVVNGIQSFTVPNTGLYSIEAFGASGGNRTNSPQRPGGFGAYIKGEFNLVQGDVLTILVGQKGVDGLNTGSGGGGTYLLKNNTIIIAAGSGGGATGDNSGGNASLNTTGTNDVPGGQIPGGTNGNGGLVCNSGGANHGGAGAGYTGNGATSVLNNAAGGGLAFVNGGIGGASTVPGAFGGGGGATASGVGLYGGGGGGGGYSGGAGGQQINYCTPGINRSGGGGGGSYNLGSAPASSILATQGDGKIILTTLCNISLSASTNSICTGNSIQLSTDAASGIVWSTGANTNTITVSPTVTTTYSVIGTSTANCVASSMLVVSVKPLPVVNAVSQPSMLCVGSTATITLSGASTYSLHTGKSGSTPTVNPNTTTTYSVTGISTDGCISSTTIPVNVNTNSITISGSSVVCVGRSTQLTASGAITYTWNTGLLYPVLTVTPANTALYSVNGTDEHNCLLIQYKTVSVSPNPTVGVMAEPEIICKGETAMLTASGATSYTWSPNKVSGTLAVTPLVDVTYNYTVTGTGSNGCTDTEVFSLAVNKCTSIDDQQDHAKSRLYPNPTARVFTLESPDAGEKMITVTDVTGRVIKEISTKETTVEIDLGTEPSGMYFIYLKGAEETTFKLIKE